MELVRLIKGAYKITGYKFYWLCSKSERETLNKINEICLKYSVISPHSLICNAKYFASTYTKSFPDLKNMINIEPENPNLVLANTVKKIDDNLDLTLYLGRLIDRIPKTPTVICLDDVMESSLFKSFYDSAINEYKSTKGIGKQNEFDQQVRNLIREFSEEYSKGKKYEVDDYVIYLDNWFKVRSFHDSRKRAEKNAKRERKELENIDYQTFRNWDGKFQEYYKSRTGEEL